METTMRKQFVVILVLMAFASVLLIAQIHSTSPSPPSAAERAQHHLQFLTTALSLTAAQQQQATAIMNSAATAEDAAHANMKAAHETLHAAIKTNDPGAIDQAAAVIGNLTAQTTAIHAKAMAAFYQILTPEQQTKLDQLHQQGPHGMGSMSVHIMGPFL
jgi:Spy/CpxP family protein refolding chaperone